MVGARVVAICVVETVICLTKCKGESVLGLLTCSEVEVETYLKSCKKVEIHATDMVTYNIDVLNGVRTDIFSIGHFDWW